MSPTRTSGAWSARAGRLFRVLGCVAVGSTGVASSVGCTAYSTVQIVPIDCSAESAYDIQYIYTFDTTAAVNFYGSGDHPDADVNYAVDPLTDGARCGSTTALVLHTDHNDNWGSLFGIYSFGPKDASAYQGLSFWARAPGNTTKAFTMLFDDTNTSNPNMPAVCNVDGGMTPTPVDSGSAVCKNYCTDGGIGGGLGTYTDPTTGTVVSGATTSAPPPDACGNEYGAVLQVTSGWQFYTMPFGEFHQAAQPNRVPNAHFSNEGSVPGTELLTSALMGLTIRMPAEADMNLELSHLGFYRPRIKGDGAIDAPPDVRGQ